ncbi:LysR substrate-binding domain-containing protein [Variovorax sp. KK3]|uniref:LysR substrate-binding domain-containing protein n=1 Tax=Variovorax sp. KK3 TaxID=1855728 RepID=UPI00097C6B54|nr:LysR substrate-binding domain-containing protein [Variovorax sp. KK3]
MRIFVGVAEGGSMSAAAEKCHLTVAAVSKRVRDLELSTGNHLFQRHARGMTLTAAGRSMLQHAREIIFAVDKMQSEQRQLAQGVAGVVRIASMGSAIAHFLPSDLKEFFNLHPGVAIELSDATSADVVEAVLEGRADVGIFLASANHALLKIYDYYRDALALVVPITHPLAGRGHVHFADLLEHEFIALARRSTIVQTMIAASEGALRIRLHVHTSDALCRMVGAGLGIGICPLKAARSNRRVVPIDVLALDEPWAVRQLLIGVRPDEDGLSGAARVFLAHCRAAASVALADELAGADARAA